MERGIRKIRTFVKYYGGPACNFEKTHVALGDRTDTKFYSAVWNAFLEI